MKQYYYNAFWASCRILLTKRESLWKEMSSWGCFFFFLQKVNLETNSPKWDSLLHISSWVFVCKRLTWRQSVPNGIVSITSHPEFLPAKSWSIASHPGTRQSLSHLVLSSCLRKDHQDSIVLEREGLDHISSLSFYPQRVNQETVIP